MVLQTMLRENCNFDYFQVCALFSDKMQHVSFFKNTFSLFKSFKKKPEAKCTRKLYFALNIL